MHSLSGLFLLAAARANGQLLFEEVLNGRAVEHTLRSFSGFEPGVAHRARRPPVLLTVAVVCGRVHKVVGYHWTFERGDDVAQRDPAWIARQLVAAVRPADAADDADASQPAQQLVEIGLRYLLAGGDFGALHRALAVTSGKLDNRMSAIVAPHRKSQN